MSRTSPVTPAWLTCRPSPKANRCQPHKRRCLVVEWAWTAGPAVAAEVWGAGWAKEWDEGKVEDRAEEAWARGAGVGVVWVLSSTAQGRFRWH